MLRNGLQAAQKNGRFSSLPLAVSRFFFLTNMQLADGSAASTLLGTGREAGADEVDFHMIRRRNLEIDGDVREEAKVLRAGVLVGVVKTCRRTSVKPKKKCCTSEP